MTEKKRRYKVGEWVGMMGKISALHGARQVVVQVAGNHITMPTAELWHLDPPESSPEKKGTDKKP